MGQDGMFFIGWTNIPALLRSSRSTGTEGCANHAKDGVRGTNDCDFITLSVNNGPSRGKPKVSRSVMTRMIANQCLSTHLSGSALGGTSSPRRKSKACLWRDEIDGQGSCRGRAPSRRRIKLSIAPSECGCPVQGGYSSRLPTGTFHPPLGSDSRVIHTMKRLPAPWS